MIEGRYLVIRKSKSFWTGKAVKMVRNRDTGKYTVLSYFIQDGKYVEIWRKTYDELMDAERKYRHIKTWTLED